MPNVCVCHHNEEHCRHIVEALKRHDARLNVEVVADLRGVAEYIKDQRPEVLVLGADKPDDPVFRTVATMNESLDVGIIVVSDTPSQELLVACMRAGADEFLSYPVDSGELSRTLARLFRKKGILKQPQGKVVALYSSKGGTGVTTIACNLAANVARQLRSETASCILDLNGLLGSVAVFMDVRQFSHSVADACRDSSRLDTSLLHSYMTTHQSGTAVLPAPLHVEESEDIDPQKLVALIEECQRAYEHVFLDLPHSMDGITLAALDLADQVLLICDMTLPAIQNTIRTVEAFQELDFKKGKLKLVINRYYDSDQISLHEISEHVRLPIYWAVPYDSPVAISAANSGQTFDDTDSDSEAAHSLAALAQHIAGTRMAKQAKKKFGLLPWKR